MHRVHTGVYGRRADDARRRRENRIEASSAGEESADRSSALSRRRTIYFHRSLTMLLFVSVRPHLPGKTPFFLIRQRVLVRFLFPLFLSPFRRRALDFQSFSFFFFSFGFVYSTPEERCSSGKWNSLEN